MFVHTTPLLSELLAKKLTRHTLPLMVQGQYGQGRSTYLLEYVRQKECKQGYKPFNQTEGFYDQTCQCLSCSKISKNKTPDVVILEGTEGIQEAREKIQHFRESKPCELGQKYLLLKNVEFFSKEVLDSALKAVEEPFPNQEILATTQGEGISGAFKSRFVVMELKPWTKNQLALLTEHSEVWAPFNNVFKEYEPKTPYELSAFVGHIKPITTSWERATSISSLIEAVDSSLKQINATEAPAQILTACLAFYLDKLRQVDSMAFQAHLLTLCNHYNKGLFKYAHKQNSHVHMNVRSQLFSFLSTVFVVRKTLKC